MSSYNFPLLSIPLFYLLALVPHFAALTISTKGDLSKYNNLDPKSSDRIAKHKQRLTPKEFVRYERAYACHRNHLENLPLYVAAVLASVYAERQTATSLNTTYYAVAFLVARVLYTANYLTVESQALTYVRTAMYAGGVTICFTMIFNAASVLGQ